MTALTAAAVRKANVLVREVLDHGEHFDDMHIRLAEALNAVLAAFLAVRDETVSECKAVICHGCKMNYELWDNVHFTPDGNPWWTCNAFALRSLAAKGRAKEEGGADA